MRAASAVISASAQSRISSDSVVSRLAATNTTAFFCVAVSRTVTVAVSGSCNSSPSCPILALDIPLRHKTYPYLGRVEAEKYILNQEGSTVSKKINGRENGKRRRGITSPEELAEIARFVAAGQDYSQREVAQHSDLSPSQVQRLFDGTHGKPYPSTRRKMRAFIESRKTQPVAQIPPAESASLLKRAAGLSAFARQPRIRHQQTKRNRANGE